MLHWPAVSQIAPAHLGSSGSRGASLQKSSDDSPVPGAPPSSSHSTLQVFTLPSSHCVVCDCLDHTEQTGAPGGWKSASLSSLLPLLPQVKAGSQCFGDQGAPRGEMEVGSRWCSGPTQIPSWPGPQPRGRLPSARRPPSLEDAPGC